MIHQRIVRFLASILIITLATTPVLSNPWQEDGAKFRELLRAAHQNRWHEAELIASQISLPVARSVTEWLRLRSGVDEFEDYLSFLENHNDWPGLKILRKSGEAAMTTDSAPSAVISYFIKQPPQTGRGAIRLAGAYQQSNLLADAQTAIVDGWKSLPFTAEEQREALTLYGEILAPFHNVRLNNLLWQKRYNEAEQLMPFVSDAQRLLATARIALQRRANGVDSRVRRIPDYLQNDPGLSFDRIVWRLNNDNEAGALSLFFEIGTANANLANPEAWANRRLNLAHWLMRKGRFEEAYHIAAHHHLINNGKLPDLSSLSLAHRDRAERLRKRIYADLEWLCGYLSLRFLDDPMRAIDHFSAFDRVVDTPISIGRAGYWLGRAYETVGFTDRAISAYAIGAQEQTTFYGQLAAEHLGVTTDERLAGQLVPLQQDARQVQQIPVVQAGLLYRYAGNHSHSAWFLAHVAETLNEADALALATLAFEHEAFFSAVKVAKEGVKNGFTDIIHLFPLVGIANYDLPIPTEIALSVARQETEFRDTAVSGKGAVGFMQIKPSTGKELANDIGLQGSIKNLLRNREYNVLLGSTYLRDRLNDFHGSFIMAIAAYNAGPRRLNDWLPEIGDPRTGNIDPIDWIEHIPYGETRNYIMRVMEAITVYRIRLDGKPSPINLREDLFRGYGTI